MSYQIPWELVTAIIGIVIGWLLAQLTDSAKNWGKRRTIKRALVNELSIIRSAFSDALQNTENRVADKNYPFITGTYDSIRPELASFLKPESLANVQRTYEEIKKLNAEGRGHLVIPPDLLHIFQFTDFKELTDLIDECIAQLK